MPDRAAHLARASRDGAPESPREVTTITASILELVSYRKRMRRVDRSPCTLAERANPCCYDGSVTPNLHRRRLRSLQALPEKAEAPFCGRRSAGRSLCCTNAPGRPPSKPRRSDPRSEYGAILRGDERRLPPTRTDHSSRSSNIPRQHRRRFCTTDAHTCSEAINLRLGCHYGRDRLDRSTPPGTSRCAKMAQSRRSPAEVSLTPSGAVAHPAPTVPPT